MIITQSDIPGLKGKLVYIPNTVAFEPVLVDALYNMVRGFTFDVIDINATRVRVTAHARNQRKPYLLFLKPYHMKDTIKSINDLITANMWLVTEMNAHAQDKNLVDMSLLLATTPSEVLVALSSFLYHKGEKIPDITPTPFGFSVAFNNIQVALTSYITKHEQATTGSA